MVRASDRPDSQGARRMPTKCGKFFPQGEIRHRSGRRSWDSSEERIIFRAFRLIILQGGSSFRSTSSAGHEVNRLIEQRGVVRGRTGEFVQLLTGVQSRLYAYICSLVGDSAGARDVLQETNLALWNKAG